MPFSRLENILAEAEAQKVIIPFWWRDDDAVTQSPALEHLLSISKAARFPIAIAAIPTGLQKSLITQVKKHPQASLLVHGFAHFNHAPADEKKAEFKAHRPLELMCTELQSGLQHLRNMATPEQLCPIFVPPWNRISPELTDQLRGIGFQGLSTFGNRQAPLRSDGLFQINTHIDPIAWHAGRSLLPIDTIIETIISAIQYRLDGHSDEPIGLLTHHLVHDGAIWEFTESLVNYLKMCEVINFIDVRDYLSQALSRTDRSC
ncbi:polysaccharide deacetylase family protein [Microvirga sp. W0021]|uniref:Polysaccharide deacetylase family protein n=1 Tax=Hohaiivirga grylli TaxID=3133970 RepID=A0ABV0BG91_9HYPH